MISQQRQLAFRPGKPARGRKKNRLIDMLKLSALRFGKTYQSLETQEVVHFDTGEPIASISQVNGGMLQLDMKHAPRAVLCYARSPVKSCSRL